MEKTRATRGKNEEKINESSSNISASTSATTSSTKQKSNDYFGFGNMKSDGFYDAGIGRKSDGFESNSITTSSTSSSSQTHSHLKTETSSSSSTGTTRNPHSSYAEFLRKEDGRAYVASVAGEPQTEKSQDQNSDQTEKDPPPPPYHP